MTAVRPRSAAAALLTVGLVLTGCAASTSPSASTSSVAPTPPSTAAPAPDELVVAGGEKPPTVAGGDCGALVTVETLTAATGRAVDSVAAREPVDPVVANVGGLACEYAGPEISGLLYVFPVAGFAGTGVTPDDAPALTDRCVNACEWRHLDADVFVVGFISPQDYGLAEAATVGSQLGPQVSAAAVESSGGSWLRVTSQWWPARDCADVAAAVSERTGVPFIGASGSFSGGVLLTGVDVASLAARATECTLDDPATSDPRDVALAFSSGTAWSVPASYTTPTPYDPGVAGITGFSVLAGQSVDPIPGYELTDGANEVAVAFAARRDDADAVVSAVAAIAAG